MSNKTKEHRGVCRLIVVKIVDSGPIPSNNTDIDEIDIGEQQVLTHEPVICHSTQQKRPISPVSTANIINNKKVKLEQSTNNIKKKQVQAVIKNENTNKTIVNTKKSKLVSYKSSSVIEEKISKNLPIKGSNETITINENTENPLLFKPRTSTKLIKSQSTNDIRPSIQPTIINTKKKESIPSPLKTKSVINSQNVLKKPINKNLQKTSIKIEQTSISTVKSPSNVIIKQESSPQPPSTIISSNNPTTSVSISNLKKIPKKLVSPQVVEKRFRSSMPSSSLNRNSIRDLQRQQSLSSKTQSNLKRLCSSSSVNNSNSKNRSGKTNTTKDRSNQSTHQSSNVSRHDQLNRPSSSPHKSSSNHQKRQTPTTPKSIHSPSQSHIDPPLNSTVSSSSSSIDTSQPPSNSSPSTHVFQNEAHHIQASMDIDGQNADNHIQLSDQSNSPHEEILIPPTKITSNQISYSDQSDINGSDISINNVNEEVEDLPTSLTNDDLRYKLIYIYKRFQLNSLNDLIIFVRFFKRHQLIDISSLSMTKTTNEMFTYDLFSLSPSHIGELANDLGYTTTNIINSMEQ